MIELIENIIEFMIYFSPAILASVVFMLLGFGNFVCMLVFAIVMCLTIWATDNLSRG